jgi:glycosyltransferase involved in cell wall biosynthesis
MNIFIVIPAYNEGSRIGNVLKKVLSYKLPVIVVDDGSKDTTFEVASKQKQITVLKHRTNLGKGAALKTGCDAAFKLGAAAVIIMDSDGQHKVSDLPQFIEALRTRKYDVIFGSRNLSMGVPLVRYLGNKFASLLISILFGIYVSDLICGYRAFTKNGYQMMDWQSSGYGVETEMVIKTGKHQLRYCEVTVETVYLDKFKGVTVIDAFSILFSVFRWRLSP